MPSPPESVPESLSGVSPQRRPRLAARSRGRWGEDQATRLFVRLGYEILTRNWRSPYRELRGELDLIARDGDVIVFCEVKTRQRDDLGGASAAVDQRKQHQVRALAEAWLVASGRIDRECRFDVVACDGVHITHHIAAF